MTSLLGPLFAQSEHAAEVAEDARSAAAGCLAEVDRLLAGGPAALGGVAAATSNAHERWLSAVTNTAARYESYRAVQAAAEGRS